MGPSEAAWELAKLRRVGVTSILHATGNRESRRAPKRSKYRIVWIEEEP